MASGVLVEGPTPQPLNRKYLRAIRDFSCHLEQGLQGLSCDLSNKVPLSVGDTIIVHLTHVNGWADGTVLNTGQRGWFPTHYCETYDHEYIRCFFHGLTQLWTSGAKDDSSASWLMGRRDEVQPLISGIRHVLEKTGCLRRGSTTIEAIPLLHRIRRELLSQLTALVRCADQLVDLAATPIDSKAWSSLTEDYQRQAFYVAVKLVCFMDVWEHDAGYTSARDSPVTVPGAITKNFEEYKCGIEKKLVHWCHDRPFPFDTNRLEQQHDRTDMIGRAKSINSPRTPKKKRDLVPNRPSPQMIRKSYSQPTLRYSSENLTSVPARDRPLLTIYQLTTIHSLFIHNIELLLSLERHNLSMHDFDRILYQTLDISTTFLSLVRYIQKHTLLRLQRFSFTVDALEGHLEALFTLIRCLRNQQLGRHYPGQDSLAQDSLMTIVTICIEAAADCVLEAQNNLAGAGDIVLDLGVMAGLKTSLKLYECIARPSTPTQPTNDEATSPCSLVHRREQPYEHRDSSERPCLKVRKTSLIRQTSSRRARYRGGVHEKERHLTDIRATAPHRKSHGQPSTSSSASDIGSCRRSSLSFQTISTRATTPDLVSKSNTVKSERLRLDIGGHSWEFPKPGSPEKCSDLPDMRELIWDDSGKILGGTPLALTLSLVYNHDVTDPAFIRTFFLFFRYFMTPLELTSIFTDHYHNPEASVHHRLRHRVRITDLIRQWLNEFWDKDADEPVLEQLRRLFENDDRPSSPLFQYVLHRCVTRTSFETPSSPQSCSGLVYLDTSVKVATQQRRHSLPLDMLAMQPTESSTDLRGKLDLLDLSPVELARQLTLMASGLFCQVKPAELLASTLNKANGRASSVRTIARLSTDITNLVSHSIIESSELHTRGDVLKHWIIVAQLCLSMENFDTLMAIMCSLDSSAIARLRNTWSQLPPKVTRLFEELKELTDFTKNFARLRQRVRAVKGPCVPFLGIYLTDITFTDAGNPSTRPLAGTKETDTPMQVVNFDKYTRLAAIIEAVQVLQKPYEIRQVPQVQCWLEIELRGVHQREQSQKGGEAGVASFVHQQSMKLEPSRGDTARVVRSRSQRSNTLVQRMLMDGITIKTGGMDRIIPKMGLGTRPSKTDLC